MPDGRQEEGRACGYEAEEEDHHGEVLLVHEVVAETRAAIGDAPTGELNVKFAEPGGNVHNEE